MKNLVKYLKENKINFTKVDDTVVEIDGKTYELIKPDENGNIFDEDFYLTVSIDTNEDFYIYMFGGKYYFTPNGTEEDPQLNKLKFVGKSKQEIETDYFLGVHGGFEILNGSRSYSDWCKKANFLNCSTLGLAEKNTLAGALKFQIDCKKSKVKPIIGATYTVWRKQGDVKYDVTLYVKNKRGWESLLLINKEVNVVNQKFVKEEDFLNLTDGLHIVLHPKSLDFKDVFPIDLHRESVFYSFDTVEFEDEEKDSWYLKNLKKFYKSDLKPLPVSDAYYLDKEDSHIKETLNKIGGVHDFISSNQHFKSKEEYFEELLRLFNEKDDNVFSLFDKMLKNELKIVNTCLFEIETGKKHLPKYKLTEEEKEKFETTDNLFWHLIDKGLKEKIPIEKHEEYVERVGVELEVIEMVAGENGSSGIDYFLILWDGIEFCKRSEIVRGHSRGSSAGALISYLLSITEIDPIRWGLLFERFLNPARAKGKLVELDGKEIVFEDKSIKLTNDEDISINRKGKNTAIKVKGLKVGDVVDGDKIKEIDSTKIKKCVGGSLPDIDIDIDPRRKEDLKRYFMNKYGFDQFCYIGTHTTMQLKQSFTDLTKLDKANVGDVVLMSKKIDYDGSKGTIKDVFKNAVRKTDFKRFVKEYSNGINDIDLILGQARSESIHACATIIFPDEKDIFRWIPVRKATNKDGDVILVSEWGGKELEIAGYLKEDILVIDQLSKYSDILKIIKEKHNKEVDIYNLDLEDERVIDYFRRGLTQDIFQFGTKTFVGYLKELKPDNIHELIDAVALCRPGAMKVNSHNEYIKRKFDPSLIEYKYGTESVTKATKGLLVTQEQIIKLCQSLGGFSLAEGDDVRKAIGKKDIDLMALQKVKFIDGAVKNGCPKSEAEEIWHEIEVHGEYSFNLSHSVGYTNVSWVGMYLKVYYPLIFWSVALSHDKKNEHTPNYLNEINESGDIKILPPDINKSDTETKTDFETDTIYWALSSIKQVGEVATDQLMKERGENGEYFSFDDFLDRSVFKGSKINKTTVENTVFSGAFDDIENIEQPKDRLKLIEKFRDFANVKVDKNKDIILTNLDSIKYNWWWLLQQKRLSGIAFFDYEILAEKFLSLPKYSYIAPASISDYKNKRDKLRSVVAGYVVEVDVRQQKKGDFARITLENNYSFIQIVVWSDQYEILKDSIENSEKSIMIISGLIGYDSFKKQNVMYSNVDTEIVKLN